jgi:pimeloyl-ACP methyl ester carboxylesterase
MANPSRAPEALPDSIAADFRTSGPTTSLVQEKGVENRGRYTIRRIELASNESGTVSNIVVDYYQLPQSNSAVVLLLPISGGEYEVESLFARYFAKNGLAVVLVHRREIGRQTPSPEAINDWLKQNIARNKRVLDWIETRQELDPKRIGMFGISMGGIQAALQAALDQRIQAAIPGLVGGDLPFVLAHSTEKTIAKRRAAFLREHKMSLTRFEEGLRSGITCDPSLMARYVDPRKIMLVLGRCDTVVPFRKGWELREQMGYPETVLLPTGHYTAVLCISYVKIVCLRFFREHLNISAH